MAELPEGTSLEIDLVDGVDGVDVGLRSLFRRLGPVIPADPHVLATLWPDRQSPAIGEIASGIERLLHERWLRIVFLGGEPHLTALPRYGTTSSGRIETERSSLAPVLAAGSNAAALAPPTSEDLLQFELAIDTERERIVLYRVLIVVEVLALLVFARFLWL